MTTLEDRELQHGRWQRALRREALEATDRADFAMRGLTARLRAPSVRLLLLPANPDADIVRLDDDFWIWAKAHQVVSVEGRPIRLGSQEVPTAHAAALVDSYSSEGWNSYLAIHRSGAIEYGLGDQGAWERRDEQGNLIRVFNLISVVARTWALLHVGTALRERVPLEGPFLLSVALIRTGGALLGNVAEGWAEPLTWENQVPPCQDDHLLWHVELADWPDEELMRELAFRIGDRLEDAWEVRQRRYLSRVGDLPRRRAHRPSGRTPGPCRSESIVSRSAHS